MRADLLLVQKKLVPSRAKAQELIAHGKVYARVDGRRERVEKASSRFDPATVFEVEAGVEGEIDELMYVSRGGLKMKGALERTGLKVAGACALDVGISTGGFSDCLLRAGAERIIGVDVGHGQLAEALRDHPRLMLFEGVNARDLSAVPLRQAAGGRGFDLIVIDVSFISLTLVLPGLIQYLDKEGSLLALVKPQFEVGREGLGKKGIVRDPSLYGDVENKIRKSCAQCGLRVEDYFESSIEGTDGNREFFVWAKPQP